MIADIRLILFREHIIMNNAALVALFYSRLVGWEATCSHEALPGITNCHDMDQFLETRIIKIFMSSCRRHTDSIKRTQYAALLVSYKPALLFARGGGGCAKKIS